MVLIVVLWRSGHTVEAGMKYMGADRNRNAQSSWTFRGLKCLESGVLTHGLT